MSGFAKDFDRNKDMPVVSILNKIRGYKSENAIDGVTISGGEPFLQTDLKQLIIGIKELGINDILLYTGYCFEELSDKSDVISELGVLIDGPYIDELNDDKPLRGSSNQRIFILDSSLRERYLDYLKHPRRFELIVEDEAVVVIGMLPKGGHEELKKIMNPGTS